MTLSAHSPSSPSRPLKVVQWATGNIGLRSLMMVLDHPHLELVGLYVYSDSKAGKDAGEICGRAPVGVIATNKIEDIKALGADCVLYMPQGCDYDEICELLASGCNVVTTRVEFHMPDLLEADLRQRLLSACETGNASIYSTGSSPGFITEALPIPMLSLQRRLDCLIIDEFADVSSRNSPDMIYKIMGFGAPPYEFGPERLEHVKHGFGLSLSQLAKAIGLELDEVTVSGEVGALNDTIHIAAGEVKAGTVGAQRITVSGMRNGKALMKMRLNWYVGTDTDKGWDLRETGWRVQVQGDTPLDMSITFPIKEEDMAATTPGLTAHRAVNAVEVVCAAAPGIRTTVDLPQVIAWLGD